MLSKLKESVHAMEQEESEEKMRTKQLVDECKQIRMHTAQLMQACLCQLF